MRRHSRLRKDTDRDQRSPVEWLLSKHTIRQPLKSCSAGSLSLFCLTHIYPSMPIRYVEAPDVKETVERIVSKLDFPHIDLSGIYCFRSTGSKSRRTVARIHSLEKLWQKALHRPSSYLIEVISERYDRLSREEKEKVIIHELLHIPHGFAGGFRPHKGHITRQKIERLHMQLTRR